MKVRVVYNAGYNPIIAKELEAGQPIQIDTEIPLENGRPAAIFTAEKLRELEKVLNPMKPVGWLSLTMDNPYWVGPNAFVAHLHTNGQSFDTSVPEHEIALAILKATGIVIEQSEDDDNDKAWHIVMDGENVNNNLMNLNIFQKINLFYSSLSLGEKVGFMLGIANAPGELLPEKITTSAVDQLFQDTVFAGTSFKVAALKNINKHIDSKDDFYRRANILVSAGAFLGLIKFVGSNSETPYEIAGKLRSRHNAIKFIADGLKSEAKIASELAENVKNYVSK